MHLLIGQELVILNKRRRRKKVLEEDDAMLCCFWSGYLRGNSVSMLSHSNAGRKKRLRGVKGDGPGLVPFCSFSWLAQPWGKYNVFAIWKHIITGSPSAVMEHCLDKWMQPPSNHRQGRATNKDHWWNHAQNIATGVAQNQAEIKHWRFTKEKKKKTKLQNQNKLTKQTNNQKSNT